MAEDAGQKVEKQGSLLILAGRFTLNGSSPMYEAIIPSDSLRFRLAREGNSRTRSRAHERRVPAIIGGSPSDPR